MKLYAIQVKNSSRKTRFINKDKSGVTRKLTDCATFATKEYAKVALELFKREIRPVAKNTTYILREVFDIGSCLVMIQQG
jgi:hypothetical protein